MAETKCEVCGTETECVAVCGAFGAITYSCCLRCLASGKEPYRLMVDYIANAGHWPEDINIYYQEEVRQQLRLHDIPEEVFKFEVDRAIAEEQAFIKEMCNNTVDIKAMMSEIDKVADDMLKGSKPNCIIIDSLGEDFND